jgi:hypothetical protein
MNAILRLKMAELMPISRDFGADFYRARDVRKIERLTLFPEAE